MLQVPVFQSCFAGHFILGNKYRTNSCELIWNDDPIIPRLLQGLKPPDRVFWVDPAAYRQLCDAKVRLVQTITSTATWFRRPWCHGRIMWGPGRWPPADDGGIFSENGGSYKFGFSPCRVT